MKIHTLQEVAELLRVTDRQVFRYLKNGKLKGSKLGKWRFTEKDIQDFLQNGRSKRKKK